MKKLSSLSAGIAKAQTFLLERQQDSGAWVGEVELNPGPTAQTVMLHAVTRKKFPARLAPKALAYILRTQNSDGGWSPHLGAASEVSLSIECYVGLRLLGENASSPALKKARARIMALGGPAKANPWTQLYCAMLGILPWEKIYRTPVEIMLAPRWLPVQLADLSYWVKTITVPMALLGAVGPAEAISEAPILAEELSVADTDFTHPLSHPMMAPFRKTGGALSGLLPGLKKRAIRRAWDAIATFTEASGDFGGNTCTAMNVLMALYCEGRAGSREFKDGFASLMRYGVESEAEWHLQCCQSLVWDTGFALCALDPSEVTSEASREGRRWLRERQILDVYGDWHRNAKVKPGGWCFGDHHDHFPVTDCTALALLASARHEPAYASTESALRAVNWLLAMQHEEGGWSAYEHFKRGEWLNRVVKFKDIENALVDIPKADVSAKVVEALAFVRADHPAVEDALLKARRFLLEARDANGLWKGNYGVNYLYGTAFSAKALRLLDGEAKTDWAEDAADFFLSKQNRDGGWGEAEASYRDSTLIGKGASGAVQSAWGLIGLVNSSRGSEEEKQAIQNGVDYLLRTQNSAGSWDDEAYTGTVFPGMVYFRYELYPAYFPLMALEAARKALA